MKRGPAAAAFLALLIAPAATQARGGGEELVPGLVGEYFHVGQQLADFPEIGGSHKPLFRRVDRQISFECADEKFGVAKLQEYFFIRWTGLLRAPRDGKYRFFTLSDDGSRLYIDGKLVVENGGLHAMLEKEGEVELKTGDHPIRVDFFENSGVAGCVASWTPPGGNKEVIPEKALFHPRSRTPAEEGRRVKDEVKKEGDGRGADKPAPPPAEAARGEKQPDLVGRVEGVFEDEPLALLVIRKGGSEIPVYTDKGTRVAYVGILREGRKPTVGYTAHIWLRPDAPDTAETVRFLLERK